MGFFVCTMYITFPSFYSNDTWTKWNLPKSNCIYDIKINRNRVVTIQIWFDITTLRIGFSVWTHPFHPSTPITPGQNEIYQDQIKFTILQIIWNKVIKIQIWFIFNKIENGFICVYIFFPSFYSNDTSGPNKIYRVHAKKSILIIVAQSNQNQIVFTILQIDPTIIFQICCDLSTLRIGFFVCTYV